MFGDFLLTIKDKGSLTMKTYYEKAQSGRSMIEMLGVLAIVGVLSAGGITGYSMAMQSYKTNALIEKIQLIASQTRSLYKNGDYTGVSAAQLIDAGRIPDANNPFGSILGIKDATADLGKNYFVISTGYQIPAEACVDVLTTDWGGDGVFWGVAAKATIFSYAGKNYPAETSAAIAACKEGNNDMYWYFK